MKRRDRIQDTSSIPGGVSTLGAMVAGISVAVERVVEVIKNPIQALATPWTKNDRIRAAILELLATGAGAVIASQISGAGEGQRPRWGRPGIALWVIKTSRKHEMKDLRPGDCYGLR